MKIEVQHKAIWGKDLYYPLSEDAEFLCKFIGKKALTKRHMDLLHAKGLDPKLSCKIISYADSLKAM